MALISYEGEEYVVLLPVEDCEEAGQVVILRMDDNDTLVAVFNIFKDKFKDEFNFVD